VNLQANVNEFIFDGNCYFPNEMAQAFRNLTQIVLQETIPKEQKSDELIWKHTSFGTLSFKDVFIIKFWCPNIPSSKSLLVWWLMHDKISTDDKLKEIGYNLPLVCKFKILIALRLISVVVLQKV